MNSEAAEKVELKVVKASEDLKLYDVGLDSAREDMSVSDFMSRLKTFRFNDPIQRNAVWGIQKKSLCIVSVIEKVHLGEIKVQVVRENKQKFRNVIDGKQRTLSIRDYIRNRYELKNVPYIKGFDENEQEILIDVNGLKFEQLPKLFQERIMSYMLEIKTYEIDEEEKAVLFFRWNNGESLKPSEKRKAKMSLELLSIQAELKEKEVLKAGLSESQINRNANGDTVLQIMALLKTDNQTDIGSSVIDKMVEEDQFTPELIGMAQSAIEYLNESYKRMVSENREKAFNKVKTISLLYGANYALQNNVKEDDFAAWIERFFINEYESTGFGTYASSGTTKKAFVEKRTNIMMDDLKAYIANIPVQTELSI